jgi:hypothetical protein
MKVSTEIDNNFGYEKITQLVDFITFIVYVCFCIYLLLLYIKVPTFDLFIVW